MFKEQYMLRPHNKKGYRVSIPMNILSKYNILHEDVIFYCVCVDDELNRHFYISKSKPSVSKNILFFEKRIVKKNSERSVRLMFYFDFIYSCIFGLFDKESCTVKPVDDDLFLCEFDFY